MIGDTAQASSYVLTILPQEDKLEIEGGGNLFRFLVRHGYSIPSSCGGMGTCGKCRVLIHKGLKPPTESEEVHLSQAELDQGWRLSCQQKVNCDIVLEVLQIDETTQAKELLKHELRTALDPGMEKAYLELSSPGKEDQRPDTLRIQEGLGVGQMAFPLSVLRKVPHVLRVKNFRATITKEKTRALDVEPGDTTGALYGLAIDIGTTTIAGYLLDLNTGQEMGIRSQMNPQKSFGADVIARIKHVYEHDEAGLKELQEAVVSGINRMIHQLCQTVAIEPAHIYKVTVAGNPTMVHLFTAVDPSQIDHSPYIPVLRDGTIISANELGLEINPEGQVYIIPAISGYVGADITAGVLFTGLHQSDKLSLFVDIGTNAEIVLGNKERMLACSTPAGPAFEGALIKHGMSATPGAIAHVLLGGDSGLKLEVIGNSIPKGICGSGLIDLIAELRKAELIDKKGRLLTKDNLHYAKRVTLDERSQLQFLVSGGDKPIYLTQQDIRQLQLAKGAIRSGVDIVLREWGAALEDIDAVYLAGAFGNYVRRESVLSIGMLPLFPLEKLTPVGNAAGQGAKLCLLNQGEWIKAQQLAERVQYCELSYHKGFSDTFIESLYFKDT
ncbi:DUF4445 domain-containing protein [Candidatus Bipolaricaulota bacterium]|nr:DUF4445 domain-containing protein [Candidatus Bipolaricaulota bacterium]